MSSESEPETVGEYVTAHELDLPCARCEAKVNEPCITISGMDASGTHAARREPIAAAWFAGAGIDPTGLTDPIG